MIESTRFSRLQVRTGCPAEDAAGAPHGSHWPSRAADYSGHRHARFRSESAAAARPRNRRRHQELQGRPEGRNPRPQVIGSAALPRLSALYVRDPDSLPFAAPRLPLPAAGPLLPAAAFVFGARLAAAWTAVPAADAIEDVDETKVDLPRFHVDPNDLHVHLVAEPVDP